MNRSVTDLLNAKGSFTDYTGLKEIMESVYGENAVVDMLTAKSVQRAFRGHLMLDASLTNGLITKVLDRNPYFAKKSDCVRGVAHKIS